MNEFIEKLIEALNHQAYYSCAHCMEDAIEVVKKVADEYNNGWIPCENELPKEYTDVLGCDYNGNIYVVQFYKDSIFGKTWRLWNGGDWRFNCIVAWQPLPAPYRGNRND